MTRHPTCPDLVRISAALLCFVISTGEALAQSPTGTPGCDPAPEIRKALDQLPEFRRDPALTDWQVYIQRLSTLKSLSAQYPNDVFVLQRYIQSTTSERQDDKVSVQENEKANAEFKDRYEHNPDDPEAEYLYALTLVGRDTPRAIKLLDAVLRKDPTFVLPHLLLVRVYQSPVFRDKEKALHHVTAILDVCPANFEAQSTLAAIAEGDTLNKYAKQLRRALLDHTDEESVREFRTLWSMEFRLHPTSEYDSVRGQIREDAIRLRRLDFENSRAWYDALEQAYSLTNDQLQIEWVSDRRRKHFGSDTLLPDRDKWFIEHPFPSGNASISVKQAYFRDLLTQTSVWLKQLPVTAVTAHYQVYNDRVRAMSQLDGVGGEDLQRAVEQTLEFAGKNGGASPWSVEPSPWSDDYEAAAETLWKKHLAPGRVIDYAQKALSIQAASKRPMSDLYDTKNGPSRIVYQTREQVLLLEFEVDAYTRLKQPTKADALLARVDQLLQDLKSYATTDDDKSVNAPRVVDYWRLRAQSAEFRGQKVDAMSFYQTALLTRLAANMRPPVGEKDELAENAHHLWTDMRGTDDGWQLWYGRRANDLSNTVASDWQKTVQVFPSFELTDLHSHNWNLSSLKGKVTLINFWATWCGPCREELPHLQRLMDHYKDHPDIQFLSLNMDDNPGLIQPFMEAHGLSMTVIPSVSSLTDMLKVSGIPQNWIVDPEGVVRLKSVGYESTEKWVTGIEQAIEEVKASAAKSFSLASK